VTTEKLLWRLAARVALKKIPRSAIHARDEIAAARHLVLFVLRATGKENRRRLPRVSRDGREPDELEIQAERVKQIEHECDEITHAVVQSLHKTFITPIDRNDIYTLITRMDDIMDLVEAASERVSLYDLRKMTPEVATWRGAW